MNDAGTTSDRPPVGPERYGVAAFAAGAGALYFGTAWLVQSLAIPGVAFATFWPPVGIQILAYVLSERRRWPALTAVFAVAHVSFTLAMQYRLAYTLGFLPVDMLDALIGGVLVRRALRGEPLRTLGALTRVLTALAASSAFSAVGGATVAALVEEAPLSSTLLLWWAGDFLGGALIVPAALSGRDERWWGAPARLLELVALGLAAVALALVVFLSSGSVPVLEFLLVPALLWAALRFGTVGVSCVGAITVVVALAVVNAGNGVLASSYSSEALSAYLQLLLGVELVGFQVLASAMAERRRALLEVREAEARFHAFLRHSPVPLFVKDAAGRLIATSESYLPRLATTEDPIGKTNQELFPPEAVGAVDESDARVLRDNAPFRYASVLHGRTYETVKFPVPRPGDVPLIGGISQDVTERQLAESTTRMAALGTLAAGVAHEINNPLSFVLANVSYAAERLASAPRTPEVVEAEEALREARDGALRVRDIVRDMRSFARPYDVAATNPVDVRAPLRAALTMAQNELRHRARVVEELGEAPPVRANEHQLAQVMLNVLVNAAQSIPDGRAAENEVRVRTGATDAGEAFVEVQDTGCGMSEEARRRVFEPFFTTKPVGSGLGLGLFLSQNLVRAIGGRIDVESAEGRGSTFRVVLPAAGPEPVPEAGHAGATSERRTNGATAAERRAAETPERGMRILVVDDEPLVGRSVARMLRRDHRVEVLTDPRAALERVAAGERFDAVLCDLMMPQMSGMEFEERLGAVAPELRARTIFVTGGAFTPGAQAFLSAPGRRALVKPFEPQALRAALAEVAATSGEAERRGATRPAP